MATLANSGFCVTANRYKYVRDLTLYRTWKVSGTCSTLCTRMATFSRQKYRFNPIVKRSGSYGAGWRRSRSTCTEECNACTPASVLQKCIYHKSSERFFPINKLVDGVLLCCYATLPTRQNHFNIVNWSKFGNGQFNGTLHSRTINWYILVPICCTLYTSITMIFK